MGGVLYSFDVSFNPEIHQQRFDEAMRKLGKENLSIGEQLEGEWEAVNRGLLKIYPIKNGIDNVLRNLEEYKLVVVSTSLVKTSELILDKIGLKDKAWKIYNMSDYGSKKDSESWKNIFKLLPGVDVIVEDGEKNLIAAHNAASELGLVSRTYTEVPQEL